jgi:hypothetical protein
MKIFSFYYDEAIPQYRIGRPALTLTPLPEDEELLDARNKFFTLALAREG